LRSGGDPRFVEHFPWFDEDDGSASMTMLYAGTESFFRVDRGGDWRSPCDGDVDAPRRHEDELRRTPARLK
jgi:hypothetical protein